MNDSPQTWRPSMSVPNACIILFILAYTRDTSLFGYGAFAALLIGLPLIGVELKVRPGRRTGFWDQSDGGFGDDGGE